MDVCVDAAETVAVLDDKAVLVETPEDVGNDELVGTLDGDDELVDVGDEAGNSQIKAG